MRKHRPFRAVFILFSLLSILAASTACSPETQALRNVVEYQIRKTFPPIFIYRDPPSPGSLTGVIRDTAGNPLPDAVALVSTVRGQVYQSRSDAQGMYRIDGLPPARYVPMAGAWGYDAINGAQVQVQSGQTQTGIDFQLPIHQIQPVEPANLRIGQPCQESSDFPEPMVATRIPFSFTLDGLTIDNGQIYLPSQPPVEPKPTLVIIYPSHPLNWNAASVALTRDGNAVLAVGPDGDRGLDMAGHVRDYRAALQLWREGQLAPLGKPDHRWVAMSGSFSSLILFPALRDLPEMPPAIVSVGAVGDAFLGIQALYDADLAIPPPYDSAVAALGRPDKDPAFFFGFSPVFFAGKLPPMLVVHTYSDEVIPYTQAETLDRALTLAGVPHELLLYEDTTHYLDAYHPTPSTQLVFERVLDYVNTPVVRSAP